MKAEVTRLAGQDLEAMAEPRLVTPVLTGKPVEDEEAGRDGAAVAVDGVEVP